MRRKNPYLLTLLGVPVLAAACSGDQPQDPAAIQDRITLQGFTSCADLESYIEDTAVRDMSQTLDSYKYGGWAFPGVEFGVGRGDGAPQANGAGAAGPTAYSTTNTQVAGVDEADFMKNDGTRIFVLSGQTLYASQSWPPKQLSLASRTVIEGYPTQMFLDDHNHAVVFSQIYTPYPWFAGGDLVCNGWTCGYDYGNTTKITVLDVTDIRHIQTLSERYLPGTYADSRRIGSSVRVVLSDQFRWPKDVKWWPDPPADPNLYNDQPAYHAWLSQALDQLKVQNEAVIRSATVDQWLPRSRRKLPDGTLVNAGYNCSDFSRSNAPVHLGVLSIATLDLSSLDKDPSLSAIIGQTGQVYASHSSLYVATPHWWWWPAPGQQDYTYLHKFDLTDPQRAKYVASGGVYGTIRDQFSMDEYNGYFRVATTIAYRVPDVQNPQNRWGMVQTTNRVTVLNEVAGSLSRIGQTPEITPGESIQSSRFVGNKGFVVTFHQTDPLVSLDLADPTSPRIVGQLNVPGYSTYIQPIDDNTLLTLGVYLPDPNGNGPINESQRAMKLSMYDVSDLTQPKQMFTQLVGTANGWSEAAWDHKAFNWFPQRNLLAIPFSDWLPCQNNCNYWDGFVSDVRVFSIDKKAGISQRGALSLKDMYERINDSGWEWYWSPWVRRSVLASSQTDDYVYAVADSGIRVANLKTITSPITEVDFQKALAP